MFREKNLFIDNNLKISAIIQYCRIQIYIVIYQLSHFRDVAVGQNKFKSKHVKST